MAGQNENSAPEPAGDQTQQFEGLSFPPIGEEEEVPEDSASAKPDLQEQMDKLQQQLDADREAFKAERQQFQHTIDRLIQQRAAPEPAAPQQPQGVSFDDLPDPVDRPKDFQRELARRFEQVLDQRQNQWQQRSQGQADTNAMLDKVWLEFRRDYADLAAKETLLTGAVQAENSDLKARGVEPLDSIRMDPDGYKRRVAERMRRDLGQDTQTPPGHRHEGTPPPAANRTQGLGQGTKGAAAGGGKNQSFPGFIDQLKKSQLDSGLI